MGAAAGVKVRSRVLYSAPMTRDPGVPAAPAAFEVATSSPHAAFETLILKANT